MGLFSDKHREINAAPVFKTEEQQLLQQDTIELLNQQIQQNLFGQSDTPQPEQQERKKRKYGVFGKGEATELRTTGKLKSIKRDDVVNSMTSCVEQDMEALSEDLVSIAILKQIKAYNDPTMDKDARPEFFRGLKASLDTVFVSRTTTLSEQGMELLEKYYKHFNQMAVGSLQLPAAQATVQNPYLTVDAVTKPPVDKKFDQKVVKKDMSDEPLFDHEPHVTDIRQGHVGDCFLMAAMASMVSKDPQSVKNIMRDNGDGTVTVALHRTLTRAEYQKETYWKDKNYEELSTRERVAYAFAGLKEEDVADGQIRGFLHLACTENSRDIMPIVDRLLSSPAWKNTTFAASGDDAPTQTLVKQLEEMGKSMPPADKAMFFVDLSLMCVDNVNQRKTAGEPDDDEEISCIEYVTVKKEVSYLDDDDEAYAKGTLWVQMLEKAYAASGICNSMSSKDKGYQALGQGGHSEVALEHLIGRPKTSLFIAVGYDNVTAESEYSLAGALKKEVGADEAGFAQKLRERLPALEHAPESAVKQLIGIIKKADEKNIRTVRGTTYRTRAAELDEIIPLITESRLALLEDKKADAEENAAERVLLAKQLTDLLSGSDSSQLSFRPFSGVYSKAADDVYEKINDSLAAGKFVNAGSTAFVPANVISMRGLNGENRKEGVVERHAYTVLGTMEEQGIKYVTLRNPWGKTIRSYYRTEEGRIIAMENTTDESGGVFQVELNDFLANYSHVDAN